MLNSMIKVTFVLWGETMKNNTEEKLIDKLFKDYDLTAEYPFEIVDKGGAVGEELY